MNIKVKQINFAVSKTSCIPNDWQNYLTSTCRGQDKIIEFTIGEIIDVLATIEEHIQRYGTHTSQDDSKVVFRKVKYVEDENGHRNSLWGVKWEICLLDNIAWICFAIHVWSRLPENPEF